MDAPDRRPHCTFLFVGGTIWRKGVICCCAAWVEAFGPDDDVALVIKDFGTSTWYRGQTRQSELREYAEPTDIAPVVYLDEDVPAQRARLAVPGGRRARRAVSRRGLLPARARGDGLRACR